MRSVVLAVMPALLAGCSTASPAPPPPPSPSYSPVPVDRVRGCADNAGMNLPGGVTAGPVRFAALDIRFGEPMADYPVSATGWTSLKIALFVQAGTRVTVSIAAEQRAEARLLYLPGEDSTTTFESCPGSAETAFPGGIAVKGPMCLPVDVAWAGQTARVTLGLLRGGC
ncbi:hypothetical protein ACQP00_23195 [Dactylosporangium sp. CS-047395]|uniref:hypothetical protein n=1 Tax=Dactylosporangium sp. CS-047395 TaxID=3239936 RepID=UPI003D8A4659